MALCEMRIAEDGTVYEYSKVEESIRYLKVFEPPEGYFLAFAGGKDSCVLKALCDMAGVKYDAHYSVTSVDPPKLIRFIRDYHPDVKFDFPREDPDDPNSPVITMWNLIPKKKIPPTRLLRYCCEQLKETAGFGRVVLTGVRRAESVRREKNRRLVHIGNNPKRNVILNNDNEEAREMVENCYRSQKTVINPIINWLNEDIWEFIRTHSIPYCTLYDQGFKRIGCIGCPMADSAKEFERYPKYRAMYLHAFERMIKEREARGMKNSCDWLTPEKVMDWWLGKSPKLDEDQITILELGLDDDYFGEK